MGLTVGSGHLRTRTEPGDERLGNTRVCCNHLAGNMGFTMYDSFARRGLLQLSANGLALTKGGASFVNEFSIDLADLRRKRSPQC